MPAKTRAYLHICIHALKRTCLDSYTGLAMCGRFLGVGLCKHIYTHLLNASVASDKAKLQQQSNSSTIFLADCKFPKRPEILLQDILKH